MDVTELAWITIKSSDVNAVVNALELENIHQGRFGDFEDKTNTFVFSAQHDWIIIIHQWNRRGGYKEYLNTMQQVVTELSQKFGEAQSFAAYEDMTCYGIRWEEYCHYTHWILARNGVLLRSFAKYDGDDLFRSFGEVTEAESFLNWKARDVWVRMPEVIRVSQQWSTEPIFSNHPGDIMGVLGYKHLQQK
ncbi:hypothetical protein [Nostoc sp. TCL26-01]|uniref:hypothetical protein n=1 Tax=Nostoc sp. TCL26-01 TaxID=2576904 RepID=UPI0015B84D0C|nr:hypothetical protein [Nostoc sp. TCL26-01]QLE59208.1 hypothetical protein FD725_29155 [Nostoc sp. TCL26-01]